MNVQARGLTELALARSNNNRNASYFLFSPYPSVGILERNENSAWCFVRFEEAESYRSVRDQLIPGGRSMFNAPFQLGTSANPARANVPLQKVRIINFVRLTFHQHPPLSSPLPWGLYRTHDRVNDSPGYARSLDGFTETSVTCRDIAQCCTIPRSSASQSSSRISRTWRLLVRSPVRCDRERRSFLSRQIHRSCANHFLRFATRDQTTRDETEKSIRPPASGRPPSSFRTTIRRDRRN